jgi:hypothetical protein
VGSNLVRTSRQGRHDDDVSPNLCTS